MTSEMAVEEIENLRAEGLEPTVRDIVRLNALGLRVEKPVDVSALYRYRRTAKIGRVWLHEPTIAHEIMIGSLARDFELGQSMTYLAVNAFVLSYEADRLPRVYDPNALMAAIDQMLKTMFPGVSIRQLEHAIDFVRNGARPDAHEHPKRKDGDDGSLIADDSDDWCFDVGIVHECEALGLGLSARELSLHTRAEIEQIITRAVESRAAMVGGSADWRKGQKNNALGDFYATLDSIRERLNNEKKEREEKTNG